MTALYNEVDAYAAQWTRNLIAAGHVAPGVVDERSITELRAADLLGDGQRHFFAGIAIWSYALRLAGWPDDRPVWTGSCPCQPFSGAGKRGGFDDDRHLWPVWFELIRECRPDVILGEQVSSPDGLVWFDAVSADLEREGYAVGALDTCAAGVGAPHIRQRLYWVAHTDWQRRRTEREPGDGREVGTRRAGSVLSSASAHAGADGGWLGDAIGIDAGRDGRATPRAEATSSRSRGIDRDLGDVARAPGDDGLGLADAVLAGRTEGRASTGRGPASWCGWDDVEWFDCTDGRRRPTQPGIEPLAPRSASHVGRLRAYGNGLCAPQAAAFIRAVMEVLP